MYKLADVAEYLKTGKAQRFLRLLMLQTRSVFSFIQERSNRLIRFSRIVADYKLGKPVADIETKYGCSRWTVLRYARLAGCEKRKRGFDPELRARVVKLYKENKPIEEIQALTGVSAAYISKTATEEKINRRNFKKRKNAR